MRTHTYANTYLLSFLQDVKVCNILADGVVQEKQVLTLAMFENSSVVQWSFAISISYIDVRAALDEQLYAFYDASCTRIMGSSVAILVSQVRIRAPIEQQRK